MVSWFIQIEAGFRRYSIKILIAIVLFGSGVYFLADILQPKSELCISYGSAQNIISKSLNETSSEYVSQNKLVDWNQIKNTDLIFVGGNPRSGTTLMRAMLDVHPRIRCGTENIIIKFYLKVMFEQLPAKNAWERMDQAGVKNETIDDSMALFMYNIIVNHGSSSPRLCTKDPEILYNMSYVHKLFPKAKFVYMIRDGRAVAYSRSLKRPELLTLESLRNRLKLWNDQNMLMNQQCQEIGSDLCMPVKYEDLVTDTNKTMHAVINFLGENWDDNMLRHQDFIGTEIAIAQDEWSTDQVKKPVYQDSLTSWIDKIPFLSSEEILQIAPMFKDFGYNLTVNETVIQAQKNVTIQNSFNSTGNV